MSRRGDGLPLGERRRGPSSKPLPEQPTRNALAKHVWLVDAPGLPGRWAGLLIEWRRSDELWEARVVYALPEPHRASSLRLIESWLPG